MALVITPPAPVALGDGRMRIFLAGAIDLGAAEDWQARVVQAFAGDDGFALYNPRRVVFTPEALDEQIAWELDALEAAERILMWLPLDAKAPVSMFEAGLYWRSRKLVIGAAPGFYRRRNLELTGRRYGVPIHTTLDETVEAVRASIGRFTLDVTLRP